MLDLIRSASEEGRIPAGARRDWETRQLRKRWDMESTFLLNTLGFFFGGVKGANSILRVPFETRLFWFFSWCPKGKTTDRMHANVHTHSQSGKIVEKCILLNASVERGKERERERERARAIKQRHIPSIHMYICACTHTCTLYIYIYIYIFVIYDYIYIYITTRSISNQETFGMRLSCVTCSARRGRGFASAVCGPSLVLTRGEEKQRRQAVRGCRRRRAVVYSSDLRSV